MTYNNQLSDFIAPLTNCLPTSINTARLIHDATLTRPLRVRDSAGIKLSREVHGTASELLTGLEDHLGPLRLHYLLADLTKTAGEPAVLDAARLGALPRLYFARAATNDALQGLELDFRPRLRLVPGHGDRRAIDTTLDVRTASPSDEVEETRKALRAFGRWAAQAWANAVASTLAPWVLQSGVTELRLRGVMRPDRRQQLAVLSGEAWPEPRAH
jgi:hypothetical protein